MNLARVASLLAQGVKPAQVATIIGCTPARISQLLKEESFLLTLEDQKSLLSKVDEEEVILSASYNAAEHLLVKQIMEMAPIAELRDVTAALRVVGERQEKMKTRILGTAPVKHEVTVVSISIPPHALQNPAIEMTRQKEVISIGENTLAPLASTAVTNLFARMRSQSIIEEGERDEPSPSNPSSEVSPIKAAPSPEAEQGFLAYAN